MNNAILVNWTDADGRTCNSVGWLVEKSDEGLTMVSDLTPMSDGESYEGMRVLFITWLSMVDIIELSPITTADADSVTH